MQNSNDKARILFVEDEDVVREHLAGALRDEFSIETASNGEEALHSVLRSRPDLIVADVIMPGLDGVELVKTLRKTPSTQTIPVLLTSGKAPDELRLEGFEQGADGYLAKPYTERELRVRIRSLVHTARVRNEALQREAREREEARTLAERAALLEGITDAFFALDHGWRFIYINQRALDYYNKTREELLNTIIWDALPKTRGSQLEEHCKRAVRERTSITFEFFSQVVNSWLEIHAYPNVLGIAVSFRDITTRKTAEQEREAALEKLQNRERRLELATNTAGLGVFVWDIRADQVTSENERSYEIFGRSQEDPKLSRRELFERFVHPEERERLENQLQHTVLTGAPFRATCRVRRQNDGAWRWLDIAARLERDLNGTPERLLGIFRDITIEKEAVIALEVADRRKDEFLAVLAHELRNPLAPIRNGLHILRLRTTGDLAMRGVVDMMDRQMKHVVRLVDDLLDIGRITSGRLGLRFESVNLNDVVANAVDATRVFVEAQQHELIVDSSCRQMIVHGDAERLTQVFANLLSNSAKYTHRGGKIQITQSCEGNEAIVAVRDNGIGIPHDSLDKVFEMFTQIGSGEKQSQGGLGIGLSLVKKLVEMHNGTIEACSEGIDKGSTFTVRLPLTEALNAGKGESIVRSESSHVPISRQRILVVDDNADAAASLAMILEMRGHDVRIAGDGQAAVEETQLFHPKIIFMDIGMPIVDGFEATRRIRALPEGADIFIVALTGFGQSSHRDSAKAAGMNRHLTKPVSAEALEEILTATSEPGSFAKSTV